MQIKILAAVLSTALLAGCAGPISEPVQSEAAAEALPTVAAAEPVQKLQALSRVTSTPAGVYLAETGPHGGAYTLYYIEAAAGTMRPLCNIPNCGHSSAECPAWFGTGQNVFLLADGETLYVAAAEHSQRARSEVQKTDAFRLTIWAYTLNGQSRTQVFSQNIQQPGGDGELYPMPVYTLYYDGHNFYAELGNYFDSAAQIPAFIKISPTTGQYETAQYPAGAVEQADEDFRFSYSNGVIDGRIILHGYSRKDDVTSIEYWAGLDGSAFRVPALNEAYSSTTYGRNALYWLRSPEEGTVQILYYTFGSEEPQPYADLSGLSQYNLFGYAPYSLETDCLDHVIITDYGAEPQQSYLCLQGGSTVPCTLHTYNYGSEQNYLETIAQAGDDLLVFLRTEPYSAFFMNYNGEISLEESVNRQYAFITKEDYESQTPNYRLVSREANK